MCQPMRRRSRRPSKRTWATGAMRLPIFMATARPGSALPIYWLQRALVLQSRSAISEAERTVNSKIQTERAQRIQALAFDYDKQPKEAVERCNLCGGDYFVPISQRDRSGYAASAFACGRCGLVFLNPRLTANAYGEFYTGVYRPLVSAYHGRTIDARSIQTEQREYAVERAEFAAPYLLSGQHGRSLLDIGGSTGVVARHFVERFEYEGTVMDPAEEELVEAGGLATLGGVIGEAGFLRE